MMDYLTLEPKLGMVRLLKVVKYINDGARQEDLRYEWVIGYIHFALFKDIYFDQTLWVCVWA